MMKIPALIAIILLACHPGFSNEPDSFAKHFSLIPRPQEVTLSEGVGMSANDIKSISIAPATTRPVLPGLLSSVAWSSGAAASITLTIAPVAGVRSSEGYQLIIENGHAKITAPSKKGLFYGLQTLNQLVQDARDQSISIPACRIVDYPVIPQRAVHLDLKSHLDTGNYYYRLIDRLAEVKVNTLLIEFEDKLKYTKADKVGGPLALSVDYFAKLSKYAHDRNIEIDPLVQGLGHASFILKHDAYKDLRDDPASDYVFDPLNPKTYQLQFSMYEDAIAATPGGRFLHVGGDEVGSVGHSALSKKSGMTAIQIQMYWLKKVTAFATAHHRIPIFWDDMVFKLASLYETTYDPEISAAEVARRWSDNQKFLDKNVTLFPANCLYARWNYDAPGIPGNVRALDWYVSHHLNVMPATAAQEFWTLMPRNRSNFQAIREYCQLTAQRKIDNILCTTWDDSSPHFETFWRGLYDFARNSWKQDTSSEAEAHNEFRARFYGPALLDSANEFQNKLEDGLSFWDTAFVVNGDRENYRDSFPLIDLPDTLHPGSWSVRNAVRIANAQKHQRLDAETQKIIISASAEVLRNKYALEIMQRINELQSYSAKMIVLLHEFDALATANERLRVRQKIEDSLDSFPVLRHRLEETLGRTRTLQHPPGFVRDSNARKHWADAGEGTDWICYIELEMNKKLTTWLSGRQQ